ncbi:MAG: hypothetical protein ACTHU0_39570 [Kofleriaceae bacterium]
MHTPAVRVVRWEASNGDVRVAVVGRIPAQHATREILTRRVAHVGEGLFQLVTQENRS